MSQARSLLHEKCNISADVFIFSQAEFDEWKTELNSIPETALNTADLKHDGDKTITLRYGTYNQKFQNIEDSVTFSGSYDSKAKKILHMTVEHGPCWSDMCGP